MQMQEVFGEMQEVFGAQHLTRRAFQPRAGAAHERWRHGRLNDVYEIAARITHIDRAIIRNYFQDHFASLPLERRENPRQPSLPMWLPSHVKQNPLPSALECKLSQLPDGYERVLVGRDVLLVESDTRTVVDILHQTGASIA